MKPYKGNNYRLRKYRRKYSDIVRYLFSAKRVNVFGRIIEAETERQIKLKHLQMETEEYERRKAEKEKAAKKQAREHRREREFDEASRKILLIIVGIFLLLIFSPLFSS